MASRPTPGSARSPRGRLRTPRDARQRAPDVLMLKRERARRLVRKKESAFVAVSAFLPAAPHSRAPVRARRPPVAMASHAPTALELRLSRELRVSRRRVKRVGGAALLPLGVITTLASKLAYEMRAHDAPFHKPLFMTLVSFVAMSLCALPQMWHSFRRDARRRDRRRERARLEASRDARRSREASHDPNPRDGDAAASDGAGLAEPLLAETDAEETEAFFSDYDRSDGGAARTEGASGTYGRTVWIRARRRERRHDLTGGSARGGGVHERRVAGRRVFH